MLPLEQTPSVMSETYQDLSHGLSGDPYFAVHAAAFVQSLVDASRQTIKGRWLSDDEERITQLVEGLVRRAGLPGDPEQPVELSNDCLDAVEWLFADDACIGSARWIAGVMDADLDALRHAVKYRPAALYAKLKAGRKGTKKTRRAA